MRLAALNATSCHAATYAPRLVRAASSLSPHKVFPCLPNTYLSPPRQTPNPDAKDIAVLGGGITGLTTAYHLARALPDAKISIFERAGRLGGWVDSELIDVGPDESVLFEWGPRSLRPDMFGPGLATLQLVRKSLRRPPVVRTDLGFLALASRHLAWRRCCVHSEVSACSPEPFCLLR